jgi:hypothetical protein
MQNHVSSRMQEIYFFLLLSVTNLFFIALQFLILKIFYSKNGFMGILL